MRDSSNHESGGVQAQLKALPTRLFTRLSGEIDLLLVILLCLFTLIPLLRNPGLPNGADVLYHTYRAGEMARSWEHGVLFPRWAEGLYYGYGSPLFHYYASLTYTLTSLMMRFGGIAALDALRAIIVLCAVGGAVGMALFSRRFSGRLGGIIAALVYVYSPYLLYTEPYARGVYPEMLALALFPWILWRFEKLRQNARPREFAFAAISLFLLMIAHNLMALALTAVLAGWLLWCLIGGAVLENLQAMHQERVFFRILLRNGKTSLLYFAALAAGIGLAAYFWLPVILEGGAVSLDNLVGVALLDFRNFFVPLNDLLAPVPLPDLGAINGLRNVVQIGLPQWSLGLVGFGGALALFLRRKDSAQAQSLAAGLFFALLALAAIFTMLPSAGPLWETVRQLALFQFPWRFLGVTVFALAFLAGMNARWIERLPGKIGGAATAVIITLPILFAFPLLTVPEWRNQQVDTSIAAYHAAETAGLQLGTTFTNEYRPRDVSSLADPTDWLLADYADGYPIDKANRNNLPPGAVLTLLENGPEHHRWQVKSDTPFTMEVLNFYWPGWTAEIDARPVETRPSLHHGFINFDVPAGAGEIRLYLGTTPPRSAGYALSAFSLVAMIAGLIFLRRRPAAESTPVPALTPLLQKSVFAGMMLTLILAALLLREGLSWLNSPPGKALPAQQEVDFGLGADFRVIGYDVNGSEFRPGDRLEVTVYWYSQIDAEVNFNSFLHVSGGGPPAAQADKLHPADRAISEWWTPQGYTYDRYIIHLPETIPQGEYQLVTGLYTYEALPPGDWPNGYRPPVRDSSGKIIGDTVPLTRIRVK